MKLVSSTGYGFTGSTAITDLIREYAGVETCKYSGFELKFFHDIKGILNLHNYMVRNRTPAAMNQAGRDYLKKCEEWATSGNAMNYEIFFHNRFMKYTQKYLEELGGDTYMLIHDLSDITRVQNFCSKVVNKINIIWNSFVYKEGYAEKHTRPIPLFAKEGRNYLCDLSDADFEIITKKYFKNLLDSFTDKPIINIHELIPISIIDECSRYFDNLFIITTERDPRDIYLNAKYRWLTLDHPSEDVVFFCKHYRWLRKLIVPTKKKEVLHIQFEDLVYKYDDTVKEIEDFLGISSSEHIQMKQFFIPDKAQNNCDLRNVYDAEKENIRFIENELSEYLYDF